MAKLEDILITDGDKLLSRLCSGKSCEDVAPLLEGYASVFLVYDAAVETYAGRISSLPGVRSAYAVTADEGHKDISTVMDICRWLMENGADRFSLLLAMGGGITTDMAGFAAAIFKRGMDCAFIPTTLLSQVDAAIGGKNGVNFMHLKNMLGVIRQPVFTFECPEVLETLPYGEFVGGSAEMIKTFIIENRNSNYATAVRVLSEIYASEDRSRAIRERRELLLNLIHEAARVKAGIVSRDQFERGERRKLNLGHTFAHAIEKRSGYGISHGEAVSMGMVMAAGLSDRLGLTDGHAEERLKEDLDACGLPVACPYPAEELCEAMEKDKKAENGSLHFVLMKGIGEVVTKNMKANEIL